MNLTKRQRLVNEKEAAKILGISHHTLRNSRCQGYLSGVETPKYYKLGFYVRYDPKDLEKWYEYMVKEMGFDESR